jgi:predicted RNA binding protein YcfA (HicA-like mRNA interferase family)
MNSGQFERWLRKHGVEVFPQRGGSGHKGLHNPANGKISVLPTHGAGASNSGRVWLRG